MTRRPGILLISCILVSTAPLLAQSYTISTLTVDQSTGLLSNNPTTIAVDAEDNVYFSDWTGLIRKVWAANGAVTTVAGTGILGYSGDGGQATTAKIGKAIGLTLDSSGNLYFADGDNNRIRRVDRLTGVITAVAGTGAATDSGDGGQAVHAGVQRPTGVAVDAAGNLYFSSSWSRVRKVSAGTGIIEAIAGGFETSYSGDNGPALNARFWDPIPGAIDRAGDLFIADYENSRIRKVAANGIVTTVAGSGTCALSGPPMNVMVCQDGFAGDGGPATSALLNHAQAVSMDAAGNLYIADTINHRIRRVDAKTGVIVTIAGTGVSGFSGDGGRAVSAEISTPVGIAVDSAGRVYFTDEANARIRVLTPVSPHFSQSGLEPNLPPHHPGSREFPLPSTSPR